MPSSFRRIFLSLLVLAGFCAAVPSLQAYQVAVTINVTLTASPSGPDPLGLAGNTATITTTLESELPQGGTASYPNATILVTVPALGLSNASFTGGITVSSGGVIVGTNLTDASGHNQFNPTLSLSGITFPSAIPTAFGNATVNASASTASYTILGASGVVGLTGSVSATGLTVSPQTPISVTYATGGVAPSPVELAVGSNGAPASFTATLSPSSASNFLTLSPSAGSTPASVSVAFNTGVAAGTYTASIQINTTGDPGAPVTIPVTFKVGTSGGGGGGTTLQLNPSTLSFSFSGGATTQTQSVNVTTPTAGIAYTVSVASGSFLNVSPTSSTTPGSVTVTADSTKITGGTATGAIQFTAGGVSVTLPVTATTSGAPPASASLSATPLAVSFAYPATTASPLTQTVAITGTAAVSFAASTQTPWLTVSPASGTTDGTITITADPTALPLGVASGSVTITSANAINSPLTIPVHFNVSQAPPAVISAAPTAVAFAYQTGQAVPASQTVAITATPAGATYTVSGFGASWLTVAVSADLSTATLSVNPTGLTAGVYVGSLKIGGSNASSPVFVPVTLTISAAATLGVSPTTLSFTSQAGGAAPAAQTVAVAGSAAGSFTVASDSSWLTVTPTTGTAPGSVSVTATPGNFANGTYRGNLSFTPAGASQPTSTIPVLLNVGTQTVPVISAVTNGITYLSQVGAPGLIVSLFGQNLGPVVPAPLQLSNLTTVSSTAGGTQVFADGIPCPLLFASSEQVNVILPFALEGQTSTQIQLQYQSVTSNAFTLPIQPSAPGLFSLDSTGQGGGAILNADLSVNTAANPAAAGTIVALYGGGGGATTPSGSDGLIISNAPFPVPALPATVTVGGQPATLVYYGQAPSLVSGVLQFNLALPSGLTSGPQPVVVTIGGVASQSNLNVYVK